MKLTGVEIRVWDEAAMPILDELAGERFVDLRALRAPGLPLARLDRELWVGWLDRQPAGLLVLDGTQFGVELTIAVAPEARRSGIGSDLLGFACRQVAPERDLFAVVETGNTAARAFFDRHAFRQGVTGLEGHVRFSR